MRSLFGVLVLVSFLFTAFNAFAADDAFAAFIGTWEYRQRNSASPTGYDAEGERIELKKQGRSIQGLYFGLQREGEHGLFAPGGTVGAAGAHPVDDLPTGVDIDGGWGMADLSVSHRVVVGLPEAVG